MEVEVWRTEAWCAMIMGNVPVEAIPYSFQCSNGETWHQDRLRHQDLMDRCHNCFLWNKKANEDREQKILEDKQKLEQGARDKRSAADAAAAPPIKRRRSTEPKEKAKPKKRPPVPRWSEKNSAEGPYDDPTKKKPFKGDGDQCLNVKQWGRVKKDLFKSQLPQRSLITESVTYANLRKDQPVYCCDKSGDGWSAVIFLPEEVGRSNDVLQADQED